MMGGNRVAVFTESGESFRKTAANVLSRSKSLGNKTLKVPKKRLRPVCAFFLRGECFKEDCEFSHVNVGADAPLCEEFQKTGTCELGDACKKRHEESEEMAKKRREKKAKKKRERQEQEEQTAEQGKSDDFIPFS